MQQGVLRFFVGAYIRREPECGTGIAVNIVSAPACERRAGESLHEGGEVREKLLRVGPVA